MAEEETVVTETAETVTEETTSETGATPGSGEGEQVDGDPGTEGSTEGEKPVEPTEPDDHPNAVQKRINKLHREKMEAKERADRLEWELQQMRQMRPQEPPAEPQVESVEDYIGKQMDIRDAERETRRLAAEAKAKFQGKIAAAKKEIPDFDAVITEASGLPISPFVNQSVVSSEKSAELMYYLAKNPETLDRLNSMRNPFQTAIEIGRIEATISESMKPKKVSSAPAPIKPISRGNGGMQSYDENTETAQQHLDRVRRERMAKG